MQSEVRTPRTPHALDARMLARENGAVMCPQARLGKSMALAGAAQIVRCCSFHGSARFFHARPHLILRRK